MSGANRPTRQDPAGQAYLDLQNLARRQKRPTEQLLVLYVVERFLARLQAGPLAEKFVLKGGMLLAVWQARRATADGDLLARDPQVDPGSVLECIRQVAAEKPPEADGVLFLPETAKAGAIREGALYEGVRVAMQAQISRAPVKLSLDISAGDPVTPAPQLFTYPTLRDVHPALTVLGYPLPVVLSEKICTAVELLASSTRVRDYADVWTLTQANDVLGVELMAALRATAEHRGATLVPLAQNLGRFAERREAGYQAYRRRLGPEGGALPSDFTTLVDAVTHFADPVLRGSVSTQTWRSKTQLWS